MMYKKLEEVKDDLQYLRAKGRDRGASIGWTWDLLPLTIKLGSTTYLGAAPASGKTELMLEILLNLSCLHGWKHVIFTPETGEFSDVYAELCHKYIGKPYINGEYSMSEAQREKAEWFISEHFIVVDPVDSDLTIEGFYNLVDEIEKEVGTIHTTMIDPWNELTEQMIHEDMGREDKYLSRILGYCRKNARAKNRHNIIINHVRDQALKKQDKLYYYPMPSARDMAGGQVWFRKGMLMLMSWRPPEGYLNDGVPCESNEVHLKIAKSKPKGVSQNGTYALYYDISKQRYYMKQGDLKIYADRGEHNNMELKQREIPHAQLSNLNNFRDEFKAESEEAPPF